MKRIPKQEYTAEFKEQAVKRTDEVGSIGRVAPCAGFKAVLLHENAALGQRLRMADDRADGLQRCTRHRQQIRRASGAETR